MKTLYIHPGACSLAAHIILLEVDATFDLAVVDLRTKTLADGTDYRAVNIKGQVPALRLDDGSILTEGVAIVQMLADGSPGSGLLAPVGDIVRYHALEWLAFVGSELHKSISPLRRLLPHDVRAAMMAQLENRLALVDTRLADRRYLLGDVFTIADAYLFVIVTWLPGLEIEEDRFPRLAEFRADVATRPTVAAALEAEACVSA